MTETNDKTIKRLKITVRGTVQGVGFRYTVLRYAAKLDLTGWVRNLSDGRVEVLAEGEKETINQFCSDVEGYFGNYIRNKEIDFKQAEGKLKDFQITDQSMSF